MRQSDRVLRGLAALGTLGMFLVNMVGFLDTQTNSAMGCGPDWPLCNGAVIPRFGNVHVLIEFLHRAIVGGFSLLTVIVVVWAWRRYRSSRPVKLFGALAVGFIVIQSLLGAAAVLWVNPTWVLALHLGFGMLSMIGMELLTVMLWWDPIEGKHIPVGQSASQLAGWFSFIWVYTFIAIYWGSYVAFRGAGAACPGWPLCGLNGWSLPTTGFEWLDAIHRLFAVGLAILTVWVLVRLWRIRDRDRATMWGAWLMAVFVATQILTGANLVWSHIRTNPYLLHVGNLMVLFGIESYLTLVTWPDPKVQTDSQGDERPVPEGLSAHR
ncbi:MAG: COX15/CtaA family protein [Sulfobacillus sp.]|nr:COX15/CtaA family protein [Sulfobacillus sp.]